MSRQFIGYLIAILGFLSALFFVAYFLWMYVAFELFLFLFAIFCVGAGLGIAE